MTYEESLRDIGVPAPKLRFHCEVCREAQDSAATQQASPAATRLTRLPTGIAARMNSTSANTRRIKCNMRIS